MNARRALAVAFFELMTILSGLVIGINVAMLMKNEYPATWTKVAVAAAFGAFAIIMRSRTCTCRRGT